MIKMWYIFPQSLIQWGIRDMRYVILKTILWLIIFCIVKTYFKTVILLCTKF